ncbi:MAG: proline dehydrogenase family protein, partial [Flavobacteriales bacterium]|nr:proline dehydrogenase family protein [Flavobacteriales bacterium]
MVSPNDNTQKKPDGPPEQGIRAGTTGADQSGGDLEFIYPQKSEAELRNAYYVLKLLSNPLIVSLSSNMALIALKLHMPIGFAIKHTLFKHFCGGETLEESTSTIKKLGVLGLGTTLDYSAESIDSESFFDVTRKEVLQAVDYAHGNPFVNNLAIKPTGLISESLLNKTSKGSELSESEKTRFTEGIDRIEQICSAGAKKGIEIYIDAERSEAQNAIDEISISMMRKYNTEVPVIFITLQMYRRDRLAYLESLVARSLDENFKVGVKLVRGAYWERESAKVGSVVFVNKKDTDEAYNKALELCIANIDRFAICNATHNEESTQHLVNLMRENNITNDDRRIHFSQLYGMSDQISYTLANRGFNVTKY